MSKEVFPQLRPDSLAHIENLPTDLHDLAEEKILTLSHKALLSEVYMGGMQPIPSAELGEEHGGQIDSVAQYMERTSRLLSSAQGELAQSKLDGSEASFKQLAEKAKEIAIRSAKEAKQAGEADSAIESLESLLVIESIGATTFGDQTQQSKDLVRAIVVEGLATEFVEATHKTFGLVVLQDSHVSPLYAVAQSSPGLLRAATSLEFTDDFSDIEKVEQRNDVSDLSCGDILALAQNSEKEPTDTSASRELLKQALKNVVVDKVEPEDFVETLSKASELSLNDELGVALSALRIRRKAGVNNYRQNDMNTMLLDEVIVKLIEKGETEVANGLVSSSPYEIDHLKYAVEIKASGEMEESKLIATLEVLQQDKQAALRQHLQSRGVSESTADWIIQTTADPDSAANIPTEFWQKLEEKYSLREALTKGSDDLAKSAEALSAIDSSGLMEYSDLLLENVLRLGDGEKAKSYLASISDALSTLNEQQKSGEGQAVDVRNVLVNLAKFEDPVAALEAAKTLYGAEKQLHELHSLCDLVSPRYGNEKLITFRSEDISAFAILRDYCASAEIDESYVKGVASTLIGDSDPISRAQSIAEALRLANVTNINTNTNMMLFFDIANREDPISLGRAISGLENSLADIDDTMRQDIYRILVRSQSPEQTAQLIVRTKKELQKQQLTIEDVGVFELYEVMRVVENAEDDGVIERYCSNWKIQRECEETFQKYLQPVRESGDRKSLDIEQKPKLADLPEIRARFEHLGVTPELAEAMLDSWLSYSALSRKLYNGGDIRSVATGEDIDSTLAEQGKQLVKQAEAFTSYVEHFGIEETTAIATTFGIYNFIRYKPEQLHHQLLSWQSGKLSTKNVVVSARTDWNGAVSEAGMEFERVLGEEGLFCFEVNDSIELAKVAVAIGNRERAMGRQPEVDNGLSNFIIDCHAGPYGILLGTRGQHLDATDYIREPLNGQRANTYRRHLGSKFRVILKACSTAAEVKYGKNIAEAISDHHDVRVEGSTEATHGSIILEEDGTVRFNGGNVLSTIYS